MENKEWTIDDLEQWANEYLDDLDENDDLVMIAVEWASEFLEDEQIDSKEVAMLAVYGIAEKAKELSISNWPQRYYVDQVLCALENYLSDIGEDVRGYKINISQFALEYEQEFCFIDEVKDLEKADKLRDKGVFDGEYSRISLETEETEKSFDPADLDDEYTHHISYAYMLNLGRNGVENHQPDFLSQKLKDCVPGYKEAYNTWMEHKHLSQVVQEAKPSRRMKM